LCSFARQIIILILILLTIIDKATFMALSSWHSHCENSPGCQFIMNTVQRQVPGGRRPLDQVNRLEPQIRFREL